MSNIIFNCSRSHALRGNATLTALRCWLRLNELCSDSWRSAPGLRSHAARGNEEDAA